MTEAPPLAGVMGWPVGHSRSPGLFAAWLARHRLPGSYVHLAVAPERFETALRALPALGFRGANVTLPHKEAALVLADAATDRARRIGAANTLTVAADGRILADNTDGFGFLENLIASVPGWSAAAGPALVIGAGGAARAVVAALIDAGAPEIRLANRTPERVAALAAALGDPIRPLPLAEAESAAGGAALIVNTTSLGMADQPPLSLSLAGAAPGAVATDIVYAPLETPFLAQARRDGLGVVDGLGMLLHQARPGFEAWFGVAPQVDDEIRRIVLAD